MRIFVCYLLLVMSFSVRAEKYADWSTYKPLEGFGTAETTNSSGSSFGYLCDFSGGDCTYYLLTDKTCDVGADINLLISTRVGSGTTTAKCEELGKSRVLAILDADVIQLALETGGEVGFAIALGDGNFMSYRFSSQGAILAIKNLYAVMKASPPTRKVPASDSTF